jgi:hypothetical protein
MSKQSNNGGPAFPSHGSMGEVTHQGMSLRDYFAAQALPAMVAVVSSGTHNPTSDGSIEDAMARDCYRLADAMLRARKVTP